MRRIRAHMQGNEKNWDCAISGKRGDGKSYNAMTLACANDPTFNIDRVVFSLEEFLELVEKLPPGSFIVADEIGEWFGSRNWMKADNKDLADLLQIFRICRLGVIYTVPMMYQVDKVLRTMGDVYIEAVRVHWDKHLGEAKWFNIEINPIRGREPLTIQHIFYGKEDKYPKQIAPVFFDCPPKDLVKAYNKKKEEFTRRTIEEKRNRKNGKVEREKEGKEAHCNKCGNDWVTTSKALKPACPSCWSRNTTIK